MHCQTPTSELIHMTVCVCVVVDQSNMDDDAISMQSTENLVGSISSTIVLRVIKFVNINTWLIRS